MTTNKTYDVAVIGAGVIGTSCAYHLVKKGLSVALVDRNNVARGTSSHCDAVALIVDKQPGVDAAMGYASIQRFLELQNELDSDFELHQRGCLYACDTEQEMEVAAQYARDMQADGYNVNALSPKELLEHEPFLAKDLIGGLFSDIDLGLNPYKLCFAFVDTVLGKGLDLYTYTNVTGVRLDGEKRVQGVDTDKGFIPCGKVVNACGVWSPEIGRMAGLEIPVEPRKGVILVSAPSFKFCNQKVQEFGYMISKFSNHECKRDPELEKYEVSFVIEPTDANNVLIGSSRNFAGYDISTEMEIIHVIAKRAIRFYPILKDLNCIRTYAGLRPFLADHLPLITQVDEVPGYYIATGHEGDGISMAPTTGRLISELIAGEEPYLDLTPFSFNRYKRRA
ncbi:FAD-binding oxidoreductase [Dysosmobacter sp. NSJ-60]|uniref:Glycine oxidase n=1 Tax=Pusillibacter faecalis TaxID=2714358 RepID=A0A810QGY3_9FIRM|nr:FAD-binding oxidoreductase [Pusillibacter faecalis]MBC5748771.1 FAD-binding oxidoreductase [Dysosmobacter hominis]MBS5659301.1 FAD-binding oxidoreductase [Oscillibacter sp.]BCK85096.1 glycine oxidase [Pusillibacter faecalis]